MRTEKAIQNLANYLPSVSSIWPNVTAVKKAANEIASSREYFRSLRAAEMEAWERTGGDYVRSAVYAQAA